MKNKLLLFLLLATQLPNLIFSADKKLQLTPNELKTIMTLIQLNPERKYTYRILTTSSFIMARLIDKDGNLGPLFTVRYLVPYPVK